jgi:hypothetical protein
VLMQDRCVIGAECTIGSKIVFDADDGTARCCGSSESSF